MLISRSRPHRLYFSLFCLIAVVGLLSSFAEPATVKAADSTLSPVPSPYGGIYKAASKPKLTLGEVMTYTIHVETGPSLSLSPTFLGKVTDPIPVGLDYVPGSANYGGGYDPELRVLTWTQVPVGPSPAIDLTFEVKDTVQVDQPTPVVNTATISFNGIVLQRQAWVTLMPSGPGDSDLAGSFKSASPRVLGPGEQVTFSIRLLNTGKDPITVQVVDPVPAILTYKVDSANHDGVYDATTKTVTWKDVVVQPYNELLPVEPVTLTFAAIAPQVFPVSSSAGLVVTNTAFISTNTYSFQRSADILLVQRPTSPLEGSYKTASQRAVLPGQEFSYFIYLHNSASFPLTSQVSDPLPIEVSYIDGSANAEGVYDPASRTVSWSDVLVPEGSTAMLTFHVTAISPLANTTRIINTAAITAGGVTLKRSVTVRLLESGEDPFPPVVNRFVIDEKDVQTSSEVKLHIDASDNVGVRWMFLKEWLLVTNPFPHWQEVKASGWIPYLADYPSKLDAQSGTHFMGVWVADTAHNRSRLTVSAVDFASLLLPGTQVGAGKMIPYLVYYPAGVDVKAELDTLSGAAHLFVWYPGSLFTPDATSPTPSSNVQTITFTTPTAGIYLFLVHGLQPATFNLSITPGGGPRLPWPMPYSSSTVASANLTDGNSQLETDGLTFNPVLPQSGLDPLESAQEPDGPDQIFVPLILR